jgi:hypothetical protein
MGALSGIPGVGQAIAVARLVMQIPDAMARNAQNGFNKAEQAADGASNSFFGNLIQKLISGFSQAESVSTGSGGGGGGLGSLFGSLFGGGGGMGSGASIGAANALSDAGYAGLTGPPWRASSALLTGATSPARVVRVTTRLLPTSPTASSW